MIRFGILGFGHHGEKRLAPAFLDTERSALSGIWRRDGERARENARVFEIPQVFASPEELCASPEVDAVFVASPDALHREHTLLAFRHGKAVLCEKPLAMRAEEAEEMVAAAERAGVVFGVAQNFRWNRSVERIRDIVREGRIGQPVLAAANFCLLSEKSPRTWIHDAAFACGGPIGDVGIHCIDALRFLLGDEVTAVSTLARGDAQSSGMEATATLALEFSRGVLATVQVSFRAQYRTLLELTGSQGLVQAENGLTVDEPVQVVVRDAGKVMSTEEVSNADAYSRMLDAFAEAIEEGRGFLAPGRDGLLNQRVLDAAFASWRSGKREAVRG